MKEGRRERRIGRKEGKGRKTESKAKERKGKEVPT